MGRTGTSRGRSTAAAAARRAVTVGVLVVAAACASDTRAPAPRAPTHGTETALSSQRRTADARKLIDPLQTGKVTDDEVECIAKVVVDNPTVYEVARKMGSISNPDLRQLVMASYLTCAHDFVLDTYMQYAPSDLPASVRTCVRNTYERLDLQILAEVIVLDPDAGQTGPLVIRKCEGGAEVGDPFAGLPTFTTTSMTTVAPAGAPAGGSR